MILFENTEVNGWESAIRGLRNPLNSWEKSDSVFAGTYAYGLNENIPVSIGPNDISLMKKLVSAGSDHRKFMRFIMVTADITAPLYWWKEYDTYKVGTVANSCSTMHTIHKKEFTLDDFSHDHLTETSMEVLESMVRALNACRRLYLETGGKAWWWQMIQLLPSSYNQKRTVLLNYEVLRNMYHARKAHKLDEWREGFCQWVKDLPYSELITDKEVQNNGTQEANATTEGA